jgi:hypothetical protein
MKRKLIIILLFVFIISLESQDQNVKIKVDHFTKETEDIYSVFADIELSNQDSIDVVFAESTIEDKYKDRLVFSPYLDTNLWMSFLSKKTGKYLSERFPNQIKIGVDEVKIGFQVVNTE